MIGGKDIRVAVPSGAAALDFAVRAVRIRWPKAVFAADRAAAIVERYDELQFHEKSEIIVYKDRQACQSWRALGFDESLKGTMIYLLSDSTDLTMVIEDDPPREIEMLVEAIRDGLEAKFNNHFLYRIAA